MRKISFALVVVCSLLFSGCGEETEDFSRYPSVSIPRFTEADYINLLSDKNPEVVCSTIVNLGQQAADIGRRLSDEKIKTTSTEYITASNAYKKIIGLLNSRNPRVVAASLRFLQLFSSKYKAKEELIKPVLKIKSNNSLVLYEQVNTLSIIANKNSDIPIQKVRQFLNNSSWVVSRSAYLLVNSLENDSLRRELINKYRVMRDNKEKLLILPALEKQYDDYVADFLFAEALTTTDSKIRHAIFDMFKGGKNQEKVLASLDKNYDKLVAIDGEYLFQRYALTMDEKFSSKLLIIFIMKGFSADEKFLEGLNKNLEEYENKEELSDSDKEKLNNLMELEKTVSANKILAGQWNALKDKTEVLNAKLTQLQKEHDVIAKEYVPKVDELFKKYNISDEKRQEYKEGVLDSREYLKDMLINKEETATENDN
ncbi:MAG: hypothetical protein Q8O13_08635 [Candidatus Omnitrophota bacterium]|nr:hypothetical protein [Candidatus Omnitrophota bacterium]